MPPPRRSLSFLGPFTAPITCGLACQDVMLPLLGGCLESLIKGGQDFIKAAHAKPGFTSTSTSTSTCTHFLSQARVCNVRTYFPLPTYNTVPYYATTETYGACAILPPQHSTRVLPCTAQHCLPVLGQALATVRPRKVSVGRTLAPSNRASPHELDVIPNRVPEFLQFAKIKCLRFARGLGDKELSTCRSQVKG